MFGGMWNVLDKNVTMPEADLAVKETNNIKQEFIDDVVSDITMAQC